MYLSKWKREVSYIHPEVSTPIDAKKNGLWWLNDDNGRGIALGPVNNGPIFSLLYPGYPPAMQSDAELWVRYFHYPFEPTVPWLENDSVGVLGLNVTIPWLGCFDIYEHYGADVVIFGSSEVYKALIPLRLQGALGGRFQNARVLQCGVGSMSVKAVQNAVQKLKELRPGKVAAVIWGYSFWTAYERGMRQIGDKEDQLASYGKVLTEAATEPVKGIMHFKGSDLFPALNWNAVLPLSVSILTNEAVDLRDGIVVPKNLRNNDPELMGFVQAHFKPFYTVLSGIRDEDCDLTEAEENIGKTVKSLETFGKDTFIYLTPTTPVHHAAAPSCLRPNVKTILTRMARPHIYIKTEEMAGYELTPSDFLRPAFDQSQLYFDPNHVNHVGAQKVTDKIAQWMNRELAKQ